jgi:4'-phosphopantetheinyl transferase EntD
VELDISGRLLDWPPVEASLRRLFGPEVELATMDPAYADPGELLPEELAEIERAVDKRRRDYAAGRQLARGLLQRLGVDSPGPLLRGEHGAPRWPAGLVGSISHTRGLAAVAVARAESVRSLGLDLESAAPLQSGLWHMVCTDHELQWLGALPSGTAGRRAKAVFCAKEALYKAQYPVTGAVLAFAAVDIDFEGDRFTATFRVTAGPFVPGMCLHGQLACVRELLAAAITVPHHVQ